MMLVLFIVVMIWVHCLRFRLSSVWRLCFASAYGFIYFIMRTRKFFILAEDLQQIKKVSPSVYMSMREHFVYRHVFDRSRRVDYYEVILRHRAMQPHILRRFYLLVDKIHVVACDLYRKQEYFDYMLFYTLVQRLIRML